MGKIKFTVPRRNRRRPLIHIWVESIKRLKSKFIDKLRKSANSFSVTLTISFEDHDNGKEKD